MVGLASFESGVCVSGEVGVGGLGERTKKYFRFVRAFLDIFVNDSFSYVFNCVKKFR